VIAIIKCDDIYTQTHDKSTIQKIRKKIIKR